MNLINWGLSLYNNLFTHYPYPGLLLCEMTSLNIIFFLCTDQKSYELN